VAVVPLSARRVAVELRDDGVAAASFEAMASPCEVLLDGADAARARAVGEAVAREAWRIEAKYSRYRDDSMVASLHRARGAATKVDDETAALLDFAAHCWRASDGRFDVTSGVLRRCWRFDGSDRVPVAADVVRVRALVGFERLTWDRPWLTLPTGMELDFGGLGKEYAVDRALGIAASTHRGAVLVNFGGDLATNGPPASGPWQVGVERPDTEREAAMLLELSRGALATSGDTRRYLMKDGVRYGHILDPRTGWPVSDAPRSITVVGRTCVEAGTLATFAMLRGSEAERFLDEQGARYWCLR
jgi:thiamine biosynthesis lipoprotein